MSYAITWVAVLAATTRIHRTHGLLGLAGWGISGEIPGMSTTATARSGWVALRVTAVFRNPAPYRCFAYVL